MTLYRLGSIFLSAGKLGQLVMRDKKKSTSRNLRIVFVVILACILVLRISYETRVFRRYVFKPVPKSVRDVRVDHPWELSGHRYVMHFKISQADLALILNSRRFREMMDFTYRRGILSWTLDPSQGESLGLYRTYAGQLGPEWFKPDDWDNSKVYRFTDMTITYRKHMQVLIYNDELGEAYFVEYQAGY